MLKKHGFHWLPISSEIASMYRKMLSDQFFLDATFSVLRITCAGCTINIRTNFNRRQLLPNAERVIKSGERSNVCNKISY